MDFAQTKVASEIFSVMPLQQVEVAIATAFKGRAANSAGHLPQDRELGQRPGHDAVHVYESSLVEAFITISYRYA